VLLLTFPQTIKAESVFQVVETDLHCQVESQVDIASKLASVKITHHGRDISDQVIQSAKDELAIVALDKAIEAKNMGGAL